MALHCPENKGGPANLASIAYRSPPLTPALPPPSLPLAPPALTPLPALHRRPVCLGRSPALLPPAPAWPAPTLLSSQLKHRPFTKSSPAHKAGGEPPYGVLSKVFKRALSHCTGHARSKGACASRPLPHGCSVHH